MKHNYFSKKNGLIIAFASILSLNAYSQYNWVGANGAEFSVLTNWSDGTSNPASISGGPFIIPANSEVNVTATDLNTSGTSIGLDLTGGTLTIKKTVFSNAFGASNGSILNILNDTENTTTTFNNRNSSVITFSDGTINIGSADGDITAIAVFNAKGGVNIGNGTDNTCTVNIFPNGKLSVEGSAPIRVSHSRSNAVGILNVYGGTISLPNNEMQLGENNSADVGASTLNLFSGNVTLGTISLPRAGANTPQESRAHIYNGNLTVNTLLIGANGKIEFKQNSDNSAPAGKLTVTGGTKAALEAFIDAEQITKPDGYDWVWDETSGVTLSVKLTTTPIELVSFNLNKAANGVKLDWVTASEKDNAKFVLEHSIDGKNFNNLTSIVAKNTASNYTFSHNSPLDGVNYYKLIQVDFNGTKKVVGIKSINFKLNANSPVSVFPNPASDIITVAVAGKENSTKTITITDLTGKVVLREISSDANVVLSLKDKLASGLYVIHVTAGHIHESQKIIVQ